jgi:hypothetical protein
MAHGSHSSMPLVSSTTAGAAQNGQSTNTMGPVSGSSEVVMPAGSNPPVPPRVARCTRRAAQPESAAHRRMAA